MSLWDCFSYKRRYQDLKREYDALVEVNGKLQAERETQDRRLQALGNLASWQTENPANPPLSLAPPRIIGGEDVRRLLERRLPAGVELLLLNRFYYVPTFPESLALIQWHERDLPPYDRNLYECEDFALWFCARLRRVYQVKHAAVVIDLSMGHAYNLFLEPEGEVYLYDSTVRKVMTWTGRNYPLSQGLVLL